MLGKDSKINIKQVIMRLNFLKYLFTQQQTNFSSKI